MTMEMRATIGIALTSAWIGAAVLLAASVAPAAFAALPSRTLAGEVVGRVLPAVFISGMVSMAITLLLTMPQDWPRRLLGGLAIIACALAQFQLGPRIAQLRAQIGGPVDALAADDPQRLLFGRLHALSVAWMGAALLAAFVLVVLSMRAAGARSQEIQ
jgi:hypothetical protein